MDAATLWQDNQRLMWAYLNRFSGPNPPEWVVDAARFGLARACMSFDPARGRFSTYGWRVMANAVAMAHRRRAHDALEYASSLEAMVGQGDGTRPWHEVLPDPGAARELDDALTALDLAGTRVARLAVLHGLRQKEIAARIGTSQANVSRVFRREAREWAGESAQ